MNRWFQQTSLAVLATLACLATSALLLFAAPSCSSDGAACDPKVYNSCQRSSQQCEPASSTCQSLDSCSEDSDCPGYKCETGPTRLSAYCTINCASENGGPSDNRCAVGFRCQADMTCRSVLGQACDPRNGYEDCGGPGCDAVTLTCVDTKECHDDAACPDGFACSADARCYRFCNSDPTHPTPCGGGATCQSDFTCK